NRTHSYTSTFAFIPTTPPPIYTLSLTTLFRSAPTRALPARGARAPELPAEEWRPGLRRPSRAGRCGLRQGDDRGPDRRDDGAGRGAPRRPDPSRRPTLAVLRAPALSHRPLAPRDDGAGADRSGGDRLALEENREVNRAEAHLV